MSLIVDIRKKTGNFTLDVSFETAGGIHALLGSSGSGKSMTLKCIAGIMRPDRGKILLDKKVLFDSEKRIDLPPQKRSVGYMFQDYALFPTMTVLKNVMAAMGKRKNPQKALEYLRRFHVEELSNRYPDKLSGGQKQRVAMARIAAQEPSLILLDEPFSALDSHLKWVLQNEMKATLESMKIPAVMVTHSRDEVYRMCTSVCCLRDGSSEDTMLMKDFFRDPRTVTGARLSGCKNISPVRIISEHTLRALDWDLDLYFRNGLSKDARSRIRAVGIRAHRFHSEKRPGDDNEFDVGRYTMMEDPFEWNVSFYGRNSRQSITPGKSAEFRNSCNVKLQEVADQPKENRKDEKDCFESCTGESAGIASAGEKNCAGGNAVTGSPALPLLWRTAKTDGSFSVPGKLYLNSDDILLLGD